MDCEGIGNMLVLDAREGVNCGRFGECMDSGKFEYCECPGNAWISSARVMLRLRMLRDYAGWGCPRNVHVGDARRMHAWIADIRELQRSRMPGEYMHCECLWNTSTVDAREYLDCGCVGIYRLRRHRE
ncbi:hypothetical protein Tcan_09063 [Toxocara canis]|uniref:Uncharacterized protein n=1 Tax=Toxocara canis TaxID=6265 RepID=A0A0B2V9Y3_TOXCA|nr:hypothetical protein Tcan_09063 [Toxocara canis]